ncbi:unnamed protein product [Moneuplotes crassus]|uniref:Uncharacterized protein n=1 Tax=Euplotes crassus TaxID=5936 RepID=A0AAD1XL19_EUPCR|nr:unnamed protein product [Moneuplotes crassus]
MNFFEKYYCLISWKLIILFRLEVFEDPNCGSHLSNSSSFLPVCRAFTFAFGSRICSFFSYWHF